MSWKVALTDVTLGEEEAQAAADVVRSGWLSQGEGVARFETEFAAFTGAAHAVAVTNCTIGLELAYEAAGVRPGDEVIVPALTFVATANAARRLGATAVFADVTSPDDLCVDAADVAAKLSPRTRAVLAVHFAGWAADVTALRGALDAAGRGDVVIVEDCAHAPGATYRDGDDRCGTRSAFGAFSFFSNKNMTTGEGGMVTTGDAGRDRLLRALRAHGMTTTTWDRHRGHAFSYDVARVATNGRLDEVRAAIGRVQLRKLPDANRRRGEARGHYLTALAGVPGVDVPFSKGAYGVGAQHLLVVLLPEGTDREGVMGAMRADGVQTSVHYPPTHRFTAYSEPRVELPVTDAITARLLTLPLAPTTTAATVDVVVGALRRALGV